MEKPTHNTELHGGRQPISAARIDGLTNMAIMDEGALMEPFAEVSTADELSAEQAYFNDVYLLAPVGYFVLGFDTTILQMNVVAADLLACRAPIRPRCR